MIEVQPVIEHHLFTKEWQGEKFPKNSAQWQFLNHLFPISGLFGGRGAAKTAHLIASNARAMTVIHPGTTSYITEPNGKMVTDILKPEFIKFINPELYKMTGSGAQLNAEWINGSVTRFRSRHAKNINEPTPFRGPSATDIGHDELCMDGKPRDADKDPLLVGAGMLRDPKSNPNYPKQHKITTTPKMGWVQDYCIKHGIMTNDTNYIIGPNGMSLGLYAPTYTNAIIGDELYSALKGEYSEKFAQQELYAKWVAMDNLVWPGFDWIGKADANKCWPRSNIHSRGYDPDKPYILACDLGSSKSAWLIIQYFDPVDDLHNSRVWGSSMGVAVAVAEYLPEGEGSFITANKIYDEFGAPARVYVGSDVGTAGNDGFDTQSDFIRRGWDVSTPKGHLTAKRVQHQVGSKLILDTEGNRRFCISRNIRTFGDVGRGILSVMQQYTMPKDDSTGYFDKDKKKGAALEDMNDAFLYWAVCEHGDESYVRSDIGARY